MKTETKGIIAMKEIFITIEQNIVTAEAGIQETIPNKNKENLHQKRSRLTLEGMFQTRKENTKCKEPITIYKEVTTETQTRKDYKGLMNGLEMSQYLKNSGSNETLIKELVAINTNYTDNNSNNRVLVTDTQEDTFSGDDPSH